MFTNLVHLMVMNVLVIEEYVPSFIQKIQFKLSKVAWLTSTDLTFRFLLFVPPHQLGTVLSSDWPMVWPIVIHH